MSRTYRKNRRTGEKLRDGQTWKRKCEWCVHNKWNYRNELTVEEDLNLEQHKRQQKNTMEITLKDMNEAGYWYVPYIPLFITPHLDSSQFSIRY